MARISVSIGGVGMTWLERYKVFRRLALLVVLGNITAVTYRLFFMSAPPVLDGNTVNAFGLVVGMLVTVIGFYTHSRFKEDKES